MVLGAKNIHPIFWLERNKKLAWQFCIYCKLWSLHHDPSPFYFKDGDDNDDDDDDDDDDNNGYNGDDEDNDDNDITLTSGGMGCGSPP